MGYFYVYCYCVSKKYRTQFLFIGRRVGFSAEMVWVKGGSNLGDKREKFCASVGTILGADCSGQSVGVGKGPSS